MDRLADYTWDRVDELLEQSKIEAVEAGSLPESLAYVFHDHGLSGILFTPTFLTETADRVTDVLCRVLPRLQARGIAVVWPAVFTDEDRQFWAMKVHRWDAAVPHEVRLQIWPLPIRDTPDGPPVDVEPADPWSKRLAGALTDSRPLGALGVIDTTGLEPDFELLVAPGGALDGRMDHGLN